jgi:pentatricopeptide repeat protein
VLRRKSPASSLVIKPNFLTYNILMKIYGTKRDPDSAEEVFKRMEQKGVTPTDVSYGTLIKMYCTLGDLPKAEAVLSKMISAGVPRNVIPYSSLLYGYVEKKDFSGGFLLYERMVRDNVTPNTLVYNHLLQLYQYEKMPDAAMKLFAQMKTAGVPYDLFTLETLLKIVKHDLKRTEDVVQCIEKEGFKRTLRVYSEWHDAYVISGLYEKAKGLFSEAVRDGVVDAEGVIWFLSSYTTKYLESEAENFLELMRSKGFPVNHQAYYCLLCMYQEIGNLPRVTELLKTMSSENIIPDDATYRQVLKAVARVGNLGMFEKIVNLLAAKGFKIQTPVCCDVAHVYKNTHNVDGMLHLLQFMKDRNIPMSQHFGNLATDFFMRHDDSKMAMEVLHEADLIGCLTSTEIGQMIRSLVKSKPEGWFANVMLLFSLSLERNCLSDFAASWTMFGIRECEELDVKERVQRGLEVFDKAVEVLGNPNRYLLQEKRKLILLNDPGNRT